MTEQYKRIDTGIVQRGKSFQFTVSMGYDQSKKQIRKTYTYHPPAKTTNRQAEKLAKEAYFHFKQRCKGYVEYNENMKFSQLVEQYMKIYAANCLKPITAYCYQKHIEYHFLNVFGNRRLCEITPALLTDFFYSHKTIAKGKEVPLSPANAKRLYSIMQSIFSFAVSQNYISNTPCRNVILPATFSERNRPKSLDLEELKDFLSYFQGYSSVNTIVKLLLFTGMRTGECLGLKWQDIDFANRTIHIRQNLSKVGGELYLTSPKTKNSNRYIFMSSSTIGLLKEHLSHQKELLHACGSTASHPEMVFTSSTGNYKSRDSLYRTFKKRLQNTPYHFLTLHSLRHCNATLLLNNGVDIKIVSEHLGHSSIRVTGDIYTDVLPTTKMQTAELIEKQLCYQDENNQKKQQTSSGIYKLSL